MQTNSSFILMSFYLIFFLFFQQPFPNNQMHHEIIDQYFCWIPPENKKLKSVFWDQSSGAQSGIPVSQTTWICNYIAFNEKYQLFNLMFFSFFIFSIPMSKVISAINRSGVCYFLQACFCSFFYFLYPTFQIISVINRSGACYFLNKSN